MPKFDKLKFAKLLHKARGARSINEYALHSGVTAAHISRLSRGLLDAPPNPQTIQKLAERAHNGVTYEMFMKAAGHLVDADISNFPDKTFETIAQYLTPKEICQALVSLGGEKRLIPIIGTIRAGHAIDRIEEIHGYEEVDVDLIQQREAFILKVKGDSMSGDHIFEGDRVVVISQPEVTPSDIAVVAVNSDEAALKRVRFQNGLCILSSSNPKYEPQAISAEHVAVLGKVVEIRRRLK